MRQKQVAVFGGIAAGCMLMAALPANAFAFTAALQDFPTHISMNGVQTSNPGHIVQPDPFNPTGQPTSWVPIYYLQTALNSVGVKADWNGQNLEITPPGNWIVNTQNGGNIHSLPAGEMQFVVDGHAYQVSPKKVAIDPSSDKPTTYVPVYYVNQFLKSQFAMQATWDGDNWSIVTPDALVAQSLLTSVMGATTDANDTQQHFVPFPTQVVVPDGSGGYFQAVGAMRFPTADGLGQLVFFFHNGKVVGLNSDFEVTAIRSIQPTGVGTFSITYSNYKPTDAMVNPTLPPQTVTYTWNGSTFTASDSLEPGVTLGNVKVTHTW